MPNENFADDAESLGVLPALAHEIRNLMQSVWGLAEMERRKAPNEQSKARLSKICEQAQFAADLMLMFMNASKPGQSALGDVAEAVETAANLLKSDFGQGVALNYTVAKDLPPVALATGFLELMLLNITKNAVEALRGLPNPALRIDAKLAGKNVQIKIWNSGPPIPDEIRTHIFDSGMTSKPSGVGHGIGLRQVRKLAEMAGGAVSVKNVAGGGVEFIIELPAHKGSAKVSFRPPSGLSRTLIGKRVLVIDDDPIVRDILALMIRDMGGTAEVCKSGKDAIALTERNFDAVLLDVRMKDLSGPETFKRLAPELQHKVIFVTGDALSSDARGLIKGASRPVLVKPVSSAKLCEALAAL
ncbi:MAG TPA: hybrid sensor histidine kinase/response regulator [Planctomycetota bacterium]|nr:hybrid sensor histidine kinase/response regulator [Planctomycetota bacterium]